MPPPPATEALYSTLQRYQLLLVLGGRRLWSQMSPTDFDRSWSEIAPSLEALTAGAQLAAATAGTAYVPEALAQQGLSIAAEALVRPQAFAGVASDGRTLAGLLEGAVVNAKRAVARQVDGIDALGVGQRWLEGTLQSAVTDAARDATAAAIIARPNVGWVRMVNPPCCSRCAVLAGKIYKWSDGFQRHPRCDCLHIPTTLANADSFLTKPDELVKRGLVKDLTWGQKDRIAAGHNLAKVLNESRDGWRVRMAADRRAQRALSKRQQWAGAEPGPPRTVHDFMAHLTDRVDALAGLKSAGIARPVANAVDKAGPLAGVRKLAHVDDVVAAAKNANPKFAPGSDYGINCQRAVSSNELRRRGYDVTAAPKSGGTLTDGFLSWWDVPRGDKAYTRSAWVDIRKADKQAGAKAHVLANFPDGARGTISMDWSHVRTSHIFSWERVGDDVVFMDPQLGATFPDEMWSRMRQKFRFDRLDDKAPTPRITEAFE